MDSTSPAPDDQSTGLPVPGLRTWWHVYIFVGIIVAAYIVSLVVLGKVFPS